MAYSEKRLRTALAEVYAYHRRTEPMMANFFRAGEARVVRGRSAIPTAL